MASITFHGNVLLARRAVCFVCAQTGFSAAFAEITTCLPDRFTNLLLSYDAKINTGLTRRVEWEVSGKKRRIKLSAIEQGQ